MKSRKLIQSVLFKSATKKKNKKQNTDGVDAIERLLKDLNIDYVKEHKFHPTRKFRFDFAILNKMVSIEYEGVFSRKSRHTSVSGYSTDCLKYNLAAILGWRVLRYTANTLKNLNGDLDAVLK